MNFPEDLRYTREHEWVRVEGTVARVGITDYAQDALGDVVYVALPTVAATVGASGPCCEVESTKSVSEVFAPVSGAVHEVNADLIDTPQMINEDPYGKGWIFSVELADPSEVDGLMDAAAYQVFLSQDH